MPRVRHPECRADVVRDGQRQSTSVAGLLLGHLRGGVRVSAVAVAVGCFGADDLRHDVLRAEASCPPQQQAVCQRTSDVRWDEVTVRLEQLRPVLGVTFLRGGEFEEEVTEFALVDRLREVPVERCGDALVAPQLLERRHVGSSHAGVDRLHAPPPHRRDVARR